MKVYTIGDESIIDSSYSAYSDAAFGHRRVFMFVSSKVDDYLTVSTSRLSIYLTSIYVGI